MIRIVFDEKNQKHYLKKTSLIWSKNSWKFWLIVLKFVFGSFKQDELFQKAKFIATIFIEFFFGNIYALSRVGLALDYWTADPIFVYQRNSSFEMTGNISWKMIVDESLYQI